MRTAMILLLMTTAAFAQKPITEDEIAKLQPSEENKKWFLERGYKLNGNSMVGWGSIDLTGGPPPDDKVRCVQIDGVTGQQFFECPQPPKEVKTERIIPIAKAEDKNEIDEQADIEKLQRKWVHLRGDKFAKTDICAVHHMHKVASADGKSWKCRN